MIQRIKFQSSFPKQSESEVLTWAKLLISILSAAFERPCIGAQESFDLRMTGNVFLSLNKIQNFYLEGQGITRQRRWKHSKKNQPGISVVVRWLSICLAM